MQGQYKKYYNSKNKTRVYEKQLTRDRNKALNTEARTFLKDVKKIKKVYQQ